VIYHDITRTDAELRKRIKKGQRKNKLVTWLQKEQPIYAETIIANHIENVRAQIKNDLKRKYKKTPSQTASKGVKK